MQRIVNLYIGKLPEGVYLASSDEVQGLIAQGRTIQEAIEIARDVVKIFWKPMRKAMERRYHLPATSSIIRLSWVLDGTAGWFLLS